MGKKKSKAQTEKLRRSAAAKLGWQKRREREQAQKLRRSRAAKLGWQRKKQKKRRKRIPQPLIIRLRYKSKTGGHGNKKVVDFEIVKIGEKITEVRIRDKSYTSSDDINRFLPYIVGAEKRD